MGSNKFLDKLDKIINSAREGLEKHDGSTLQAIANNIRDGLASARSSLGGVKDSLSQNEKAMTLLDDVKKLGEDLGSAIKSGDKKLSAKILDLIDKKIKEYKREQKEQAEGCAAQSDKPEAESDVREEKKDTPALEK